MQICSEKLHSLRVRVFSLLMLAVLSAAFGLFSPAAHAAEAEEQFVAVNGRTGIFCNSSTQEVYDFLTQEMGLNNAAACGVLASMADESNFRPGVGTNYYGLCQWGGVRKTKLFNYLSSNGYSRDSMRGQLEFLYSELQSTFPKVLTGLREVEDTADGAYEAGYLFCYWFEIPADRDGGGRRRGNEAYKTYLLNGFDIPPVPEVEPIEPLEVIPVAREEKPTYYQPPVPGVDAWLMPADAAALAQKQAEEEALAEAAKPENQEMDLQQVLDYAQQLKIELELQETEAAQNETPAEAVLSALPEEELTAHPGEETLPEEDESSETDPQDRAPARRGAAPQQTKVKKSPDTHRKKFEAPPAAGGGSGGAEAVPGADG